MWRVLLIAIVVLEAQSAHAWGRRGHSIVCQTAAYMTAKEEKGGFLKAHSFDLGYYCNIPDLAWKKGDLYQKEWFNHFMDLEIFDRAFKEAGDSVKNENPYLLSRDEFNAKFPTIENSAGRAYWRVRELLAGMEQIIASLKRTDLDIKERHEHQANWLLHAGAIGHYIGDLAQPLHVTENYDGQMTDQKGIHAWFEDTLVNELFLEENRGLESDVLKKAESIWRKRQKAWSTKTPLALMEEVTTTSNHRLKKLLALDKRMGRKDLKKAAQTFRPMIVEQLAEGSALLAELWRRGLGWDYNGTKFHNFLTTPPFLEIPTKATP